MDNLRDSAVYALALLRITEAKLVNGGKSYETKKTKK